MRRIAHCRVIDKVAITANIFLQDFFLSSPLCRRSLGWLTLFLVELPPRSGAIPSRAYGEALYPLPAHEPGGKPRDRSLERYGANKEPFDREKLSFIGYLLGGGGFSLTAADNLVRLVADQFGHMIESGVKLANPEGQRAQFDDQITNL